jgi:hypothetical protein
MGLLKRGQCRDSRAFLVAYKRACCDVGGQDWGQLATAVFGKVRDQLEPVVVSAGSLFDRAAFLFYAEQAERVLTGRQREWQMTFACLAYDQAEVKRAAKPVVLSFPSATQG